MLYKNEITPLELKGPVKNFSQASSGGRPGNGIKRDWAQWRTWKYRNRFVRGRLNLVHSVVKLQKVLLL